ncbi:MAG: hypothetical protein MGU50_02715 [Trichodesmium sp. MAG_R02]|jgi:hypothetical protein|nr:hypothetical protein [Trichodesmium sp. MAG_R02]
MSTRRGAVARYGNEFPEAKERTTKIFLHWPIVRIIFKKCLNVNKSEILVGEKFVLTKQKEKSTMANPIVLSVKNNIKCYLILCLKKLAQLYQSEKN